MLQKLFIGALLFHSMVVFSMENQVEEWLDREKHPNGCEKPHNREDHFIQKTVPSAPRMPTRQRRYLYEEDDSDLNPWQQLGVQYINSITYK